MNKINKVFILVVIPIIIVIIGVTTMALTGINESAALTDEVYSTTENYVCSYIEVPDYTEITVNMEEYEYGITDILLRQYLLEMYALPVHMIPVYNLDSSKKIDLSDFIELKNRLIA